MAASPRKTHHWATLPILRVLPTAREPRLSCPAMKKPREILQPRWAVYRLGGKRAERILFTVTAPNSDATIERVIKEYEIPEHERWRISAQREGFRWPTKPSLRSRSSTSEKPSGSSPGSVRPSPD
jgi:hypothetical protein